MKSKDTGRQTGHIEKAPDMQSYAEEVRYSSDESSSDSESELDSDDEPLSHVTSRCLPVAPPRKRQRREIPYRTERIAKRERRQQEFRDALKDLQKLMKSKKTCYVAGANGLQARRTAAMETHLRLVIKNGRTSIDASERAAESRGFAAKWGGRQVRKWTRHYIQTRDLPKSRIGHHAKVYSLLSDPVIAAELRAYIRSNKWAMDPEKLSKFTQDKLVPKAAREYLEHVTQNEMPRGLKRYMEIELFPRIHLRVGRGISLSTAQRWLHKEGFKYTNHKKGLYFDGHDRPDVVEFRQGHFLPAMKAYEARLVRYVVGDVDQELIIPRENYVERRLVLLAQDEMTSQANDITSKMWVFEDQHRLRKKGVGRGLHKSDTLCSTVGWLEDGTQTLEYGKNYEGYWTGELFVKQVNLIDRYTMGICSDFCTKIKEKIIPAFERAHGAGYQALIMVDNSQGHSAYSEDALLVSRMNVHPGGKQAQMHDGWFIRDGSKIIQPMVYPANHPTHANAAKGIKAVLTERGLYKDRLRGKCKKCTSDSCCGKRILELQPDFQQQKSLVQEVIEAAGHLCILLPKFHCELNFIEFFWGAVKKYLRDNCDYTFDTLKENMPKALASVQLQTIRRWEHRMYRWMDAYRAGMGTTDAQKQVKAFSSTKYKSHRRVPEAVARTFDQ